MQTRSVVVLVAAILGLVGVGLSSACGSEKAPSDSTPRARAVSIESIEPASGPAKTVVVLRGSGFAATDNDVGFRHPDIGERWDHTGWLTGVASEDGTTLRFPVPDNFDVLLGACAFSQLGPNEACPSIGLMLPPGEVEIVVANANGVSNAVAFAVRDGDGG